MNNNYFENIFDFIEKFDYNNINDYKFFVQILYDILINDEENNYPEYIKNSIFELFYKIILNIPNTPIENRKKYCIQMNMENSINEFSNNDEEAKEFARVFSNRVLVPAGLREENC